MQFFIDQNPFTASLSDLENLFNGITDSESKVTAESADIIGGKLFEDAILLKSDQGVEKVLKNRIVIASKTHHEDSRLLTPNMLE